MDQPGLSIEIGKSEYLTVKLTEDGWALAEGDDNVRLRVGRDGDNPDTIVARATNSADELVGIWFMTEVEKTHGISSGPSEIVTGAVANAELAASEPAKLPPILIRMANGERMNCEIDVYGLAAESLISAIHRERLGNAERKRTRRVARTAMDGLWLHGGLVAVAQNWPPRED
ncbi:MAG TPA: hypothetical protein VLF40_00385 [Candidatus Saccharimonadales bacterium]|nr:hypothetical protein [Candidatus Saccharimonadales bacterium]